MAFGAAELIDVVPTWSQGSKRQYTLVLRVLADESDPEADCKSPNSVLKATNVPKIWSEFETTTWGGASTDPRAYCVSKTASRPDKASWRLWHVTCQFETLTREQKKKSQHPFDRPAEITDGASIFAVAKHIDINGVPILNGAKQLFNPANEADEARATLTVTKNLAARLDKNVYINRVNSDSFDQYSAGFLKIQDIQQVRRIEEFDANGDDNPVEVEFWEVSVVMEGNPDGWQLSALNAGRKQLNGGVIDNSDVRDPAWPLSAAGAFLLESTLPGSSNFIDADIYRTANYASMGLL